MDASRIGALAADCGLSDVPHAVAVRSDTGSTNYVQGRWSDGHPVSADDRFYGASLAKQMTGAIVALLVRKAGLDVDMPIGLFLPELPSWRDDVTIRHLLHHLGGLADPPPAVDAGHWHTERAMRILRDFAELPTPPGSQYRYSNLGYVCLAIAVEYVAGVPFADFVDMHLIAPLDLTGTGFSTTPDFPQLTGMGPVHPLTVGDGGLWTTAPAFADWLDHQNRDTLGIADLVQRPHGPAADYGWGIGLRMLHGHPLFIHGGGWPGAHSKAVRCPALSLSIVALSAADSDAGVVALVDALLDAMATRRELG